MLSLPATGGCQCGRVRYELDAAPYVAYTCHCRECRRLSASAFTTCAQVPAEALRFPGHEPASRARAADSGNTLTTWFCARCGSALYSQSSARPRISTVYVGTLDRAEEVEIAAHIFTRSKLPWVVLPAAQRCFEQAGDWTRDYAHDIERYRPRA